MQLKCPVCGKEYDWKVDICRECYFPEMNRRFLSKEDKEEWMQKVVLPFRMEYEKDRRLELMEELMEKKEQEQEKNGSENSLEMNSSGKANRTGPPEDGFDFEAELDKILGRELPEDVVHLEMGDEESSDISSNSCDTYGAQGETFSMNSDYYADFGGLQGGTDSTAADFGGLQGGTNPTATAFGTPQGETSFYPTESYAPQQESWSSTDPQYAPQDGMFSSTADTYAEMQNGTFSTTTSYESQENVTYNHGINSYGMPGVTSPQTETAYGTQEGEYQTGTAYGLQEGMYETSMANLASQSGGSPSINTSTYGSWDNPEYTVNVFPPEYTANPELPEESAFMENTETPAPLESPEESAFMENTETPTPLELPEESAFTENTETPTPLESPEESAFMENTETPAPPESPEETDSIENKEIPENTEDSLPPEEKKFQVRKIRKLEDRLWIDVDWPEQADRILVLYGEDGYAKNPKDYREKSASVTTRTKYRKDTCLYLENIQNADYFISLYCGRDLEEGTEYFEEAHVKFDCRKKEKIKYSIQIKGLFERQLEVEFSAENETFRLPAVDIVSKENTVPIDASSGTVVGHIKEQKVEKSFLWTCPLNTLPKNSYLKAFFSEASSYDRLSLRPEYGTKFKIK